MLKINIFLKNDKIIKIFLFFDIFLLYIFFQLIIIINVKSIAVDLT